MRNNYPAELGLPIVLAEIREHSLCAYGASALNNISVLDGLDAVNSRLDSIDSVIREWDKVAKLEKCQVNIDKQVSKLTSGMSLDVFELLDVGEVLLFSQELRKIFATEDYAGMEIGSLAADIADYEGFCKKLSQIINPDGTISSNASDKLYKIRQDKQNLSRQINALFAKYFQNKDYDEYFIEKAPVIREGRLALAVKATYKRVIKGMLVDVSDSGDTVYIEPFDIVDANNNLRELDIAEKVEIDNILRDLSTLLRNNVDEIKQIIGAIGDIDRVIAIASYCRSKDMTRPLFSDRIVLYELKNPLIENAYPLTFKWEQDKPVLIISGANTSGKTALIKSVGLTCLMGAMGMYIPAGFDSQIMYIKNVFVDIGDSQDIEHGLSSFSGHVKNLNNIVENVDEDSLVLLDEIGSSTDPQEGAALGIAYIEQISRKGRVIATTHLLPLKTYAIEHFSTGAMYHRDNKYIYEHNSISSSNAISIAKELGTKSPIIERAASLIDEKYVDIENVYRYLEEEKHRLSEKNSELDNIISENEAVQVKLDSEMSALKLSKKKILDEYREKLKSDIEAIKDNLKNKLGGKVNAREYAAVMSELNQDIARIEGQPEETKKVPPKKTIIQEKEAAEKLTVGSKCYYHAMEKEGVIQSISDGKAVVLFGIIKMSIPLSELSPSIEESAEKKEKTKYRSDFVRVSQDMSGVGLTLDIRGYRALDGVDAVEQYLDKVSQIGYKEVTILHGKGTGQLKKAVQDYLKKSPYVKKYREGKIGEGDAGITVVEVK